MRALRAGLRACASPDYVLDIPGGYRQARRSELFVAGKFLAGEGELDPETRYVSSTIAAMSSLSAKA